MNDSRAAGVAGTAATGSSQAFRITLKGLARLLLSVLLVSALCFFLEDLAPGDVRTAERLERPWTPAERLAAHEVSPGRSLVAWLQGIVRGDLGRTASTGEPVRELLLPRLGSSLRLASLGWLLAWTGALIVAWIEVARPGSVLAVAVESLGAALFSVPPAAFALFGALAAAERGWLPPLFSDRVPFTGWILPSWAIALCLLPRLSRLVADELKSEVSKLHSLQARAWGLGGHRVLLRCLRLKAPVFWTRAGLSFGTAIALGMVVEIAFSWPGIGALALRSFGEQDAVLLAGVLSLTTACSVSATIVGDLLAAAADPRVESSGGLL
ncbi:MAG: ABC transporter permease [Acidobacteriota bacterium]